MGPTVIPSLNSRGCLPRTEKHAQETQPPSELANPPIVKTGGVFGGLDFHAAERESLGLGFDDADGLSAGIEHVVGETAFEGELADGDAGPGGDVHLIAVLHDPSALLQQPVDLTAGFLLRCIAHACCSCVS
jgi:hypothetical protein